MELRTGGETRRVFRLNDTSNTSPAIATWRTASSTTKNLEFSLYPVAVASAFLFDVIGKTTAGVDVQVFHFGVFPNGTLSRYDALARRWVPMSSPGAVPLGRWSRLRVEAAVDTARVLVDGTVVGTAVPTMLGAAMLDGHVFSSGGTVPTGDDVMIDDVYFR